LTFVLKQTTDMNSQYRDGKTTWSEISLVRIIGFETLNIKNRPYIVSQTENLNNFLLQKIDNLKIIEDE